LRYVVTSKGSKLGSCMAVELVKLFGADGQSGDKIRQRGVHATPTNLKLLAGSSPALCT